jgi:hypothetical protein
MPPLHSKGRNLLEVQTENALTDGPNTIFFCLTLLIKYISIYYTNPWEVDVMAQAESRAYWKCKTCNFTIYASVPPDTCPVCRNQCKFKDITCYLPECGGPAYIDPRLK